VIILEKKTNKTTASIHILFLKYVFILLQINMKIKYIFALFKKNIAQEEGRKNRKTRFFLRADRRSRYSLRCLFYAFEFRARSVFLPSAG